MLYTLYETEYGHKIYMEVHDQDQRNIEFVIKFKLIQEQQSECS